MSWIFKSLNISDHNDEQQHQLQNDTVSPGTGVKDDLSAIGESIGRQLRGVAAFLAPPPDVHVGEDGGDGSSKALAGIRSDLVEIGSSAVTGISKLASSFLHLNEEKSDNDGGDDKAFDNYNDGGDDDDDDGDGVGITDEVAEFASQISSRPELWTDFPLPLDQEFDMSDAQSEHASVIELLVPSLADLRSKLSSDISEGQFWMIYFILLLPRLDDDGLELLSTPEIVEARETLLLLLRNKRDSEIDSENPETGGPSELENEVDGTDKENSEPIDKVMYESPSISKNIESNESNNTKKLTEVDGNRTTSADHDQSGKVDGGLEINRTLSSEGITSAGNSNVTTVSEEHENIDSTGTDGASKRFQSEDDVSFSDLEDDDSDLPNRQTGSVQAQSTGASSPEGSSEWIRLNKSVGSRGRQLKGQSSTRERDSEGEESNDWLTVDDFDP